MSVKIQRKLGTVVKVPPQRVMGIDPSTKTGVVMLDPALHLPAFVGIAEFPGLTGVRRVQAIAKLVGKFIIDAGPDEVFIEGLGYGNKWTLVVLSQLAYAIRVELVNIGIQWWDVPPSTLKQWTTGSGRADKQAMATAVKSRWGYEHKSDDVTDAYALARLGQYVLSGNTLKGVQHGN